MEYAQPESHTAPVLNPPKTPDVSTPIKPQPSFGGKPPPPKNSGSSYEFKVLSFIANIGEDQGSKEVALQLQSAINWEAAQQWEYVRLETVETYIRGSSGCLGFGGTEPRMDHFKMIVLKRKK
jgi:hypothetical protein